MEFADEGRIKFHSLITSRSLLSAQELHSSCATNTVPPQRSLQGNKGFFSQHLTRWDVWPQKQSRALGPALSPPPCCAWPGMYPQVTLPCPSGPHSHLRDTLRIGIPSADSTHSAVPKDPDETLFDSSFLQQTCDI